MGISLFTSFNFINWAISEVSLEQEQTQDHTQGLTNSAFVDWCLRFFSKSEFIIYGSAFVPSPSTLRNYAMNFYVCVSLYVLNLPLRGFKQFYTVPRRLFFIYQSTPVIYAVYLTGVRWAAWTTTGVITEVLLFLWHLCDIGGGTWLYAYTDTYWRY